MEFYQKLYIFQGFGDSVCDQGGGYDRGLHMGGGEHVYAVGMDEEHVHRIQGVGECTCDQAGGEHDGYLRVAVAEGFTWGC